MTEFGLPAPSASRSSQLSVESRSLYPKGSPFPSTKKGLKKLTAKHKTILFMHLQGVSGAEIARQLGCTQATVYNVIHDPLSKQVIDHFQRGYESDLNALFPLAVDAVRRAISSADIELALKGVDRFQKMTGRGDEARVAPTNITVIGEVRAKFVQELKRAAETLDGDYELSIPSDLLPPPRMSWKKTLAQLPPEKQETVLGQFADDELYRLLGDWFLSARREQFPPESSEHELTAGDWFIWLIIAGRGFGKNFTGSHFIINEHQHGGAQNSAIVAATATDLRRFCLEGPSGILNQAPSDFRPEFKPTKLKLVWPNKTETHLYTSERPDRLRGPNHDIVWCDELSYWRYLEQAWDNLMMTVRFGTHNRIFISMTPRPLRLIKEIMNREGKDTIIVRGATMENSDNLSPTFIEQIKDRYYGTRLWDQEVLGKYLEDIEGALWNRDLIDQNRVKFEDVPEFTRIGVAVDPAVTSGDRADETGIVVGAIDRNKHGYVLEDLTMKGTPEAWARRAVIAYHRHNANFIVAEKNQGGEMVSHTLRTVDENVPVKLVHASQGKVARAEPVAALDEQHKIHHVGAFPEMEDEMCSFVPGDIKESPNRVDARTWLFHELMVGRRLKAGAWGRRKAA